VSHPFATGGSFARTRVDWAPAGLWVVVIAIGRYHGVNPGIGWPLAVSAGGKSPRALVATLWPLTVGQLLAMLVVVILFSLLVALVYWQRQVQIGASLLVIGFGIFRLINRRHPRVLARIRPTQPGLWSFTVAIPHGAGLMLARIIRSHPLMLRRHESHSTSGCADMSSRGHFAVAVGRGLGLGWRLTERATGGAAAPRFRRSDAANVPAPVRRLPDPACWSAGAA
jgi:hypothetical protein